MTYLITQTFVLLLLAGLLGLILGWYLTRISAQGAQASMQARLNSAEADARELRSELDSAVSARGHAEAERTKLAEQLAAAGAHQPTGDDDALARLQRDLDQCRDQLSAANASFEPAPRSPAAGSVAPIPMVSAAAAQAAAAMAGDDAAPPPSDDGSGEADDLRQIKGIGPKIAGILEELGIRRFEQIAAWTPENVAWVNDHLKFKGRIEREKWIPQAEALIAARED